MLEFLGGKGLIIGAIAGFAIGAVKGIYNYLNEKGKEAEEIVMQKTKENVDAIADALKEGDTEEANRKAKEITKTIQMLDYNQRSGKAYTDFLSERGLQFRDQVTAAMLAAGQASKDTSLINAANKYRADLMGDNAANVSNDQLMAEIRNATKGMDRLEIELYLAKS